MPKDVFEAIVDLEFQDFMPRLEAELASMFDPFEPMTDHSHDDYRVQ